MTPTSDLAAAIAEVYQAPLEEFVSRRDALAKELRAEKRRDDAALVKALRKPTRIAWSLDAVAREAPASIEHLDAAIRNAQTGVDLRTALESVKEAVRAVAAVGARVAVRAGHPVDPNALGMAVHAIIGDATAFAELRAGRLVDVPEGGGLDLLSALAASPVPDKPKSAPKAAAPAAEKPKPDPRAELRASARAELHRAEKRLGEMREESEHAVRSLRDAAARLEAAQRALALAQAEVEAERRNVDHTQRHADAAADNVEEAERAVEQAQARLTKLE